MSAAFAIGLSEHEIILSHGILSIGRSKANEMVVSLPTTSSSHAKIVTFNQSAYIQDQESKNGTFVNGKKIQCQRLHTGDHVTVGEYTFIIAGIL